MKKVCFFFSLLFLLFIKVESLFSEEVAESPVLLILFDCPHWDYSDGTLLFRSIARSQATSSSSIGHAWIYLKGNYQGKAIEIEGGHCAEFGRIQPKYFEGIMNYAQYGSLEKKDGKEKKEPNPIKYLWEPQKDGIFQKGSGGHIPNYAIDLSITQKQFESIYLFLAQKKYAYTYYHLIYHQCCSLILHVLELCQITLDPWIEVSIPSQIKIADKSLSLWTDPSYKILPLMTPDTVKKELENLFSSADAQNALNRYAAIKNMDLKQKPAKVSFIQALSDAKKKIERYLLYRSIH